MIRQIIFGAIIDLVSQIVVNDVFAVLVFLMIFLTVSIILILGKLLILSLEFRKVWILIFFMLQVFDNDLQKYAN